MVQALEVTNSLSFGLCNLIGDEILILSVFLLGSGGNFRSRGRGGFGNRSLISGSNIVPLGNKRQW